jgi:hypothetical protein
MKTSKSLEKQIAWVMWIALEVFAMQAWCAAGPRSAANSVFNAYVQNLEGRLQRQHGGARDFLAATPPEALRRLREGELIGEQLTPAGLDTPGAMLHHWRGTAFVAGARAEDFERLLQDFTAYPQHMLRRWSERGCSHMREIVTRRGCACVSIMCSPW